MPPLGVELLGGTCDRHTPLTLLFLKIHVKGEGERHLTQAFCLCLKCLQFTLRNSTELEEQEAGRGAFAAVAMATDDDGQVLIIGGARHGYQRNGRILYKSHKSFRIT